MPARNQPHNPDRRANSITASRGSIGTRLNQQPVLVSSSLPLIPRLVRAIGRMLGQ